jgi:hypothetical protein
MAKWITKNELLSTSAVTGVVGDTALTPALICTVDPTVLTIDAQVTGVTTVTTTDLVLQHQPVVGTWSDVAVAHVTTTGITTITVHPSDAQHTVLRDRIRVVARTGNAGDSITLSQLTVSRMK